MPSSEIAYLIGIFDGEGSVCAGEKKGVRSRWTIHVSVSMGSQEVIEMFGARWGGSVSEVRVKKEGYQRIWRWQVQGASAIPFLTVASKRSIVKRRQAELGLQLARSMARYRNERRVGVSVTRGDPYISDEEMSERTRLATEIRSLNGARSRWAKGDS